MTRGTIAGVPVDISRTGYTGDLGYEIWMPWDRAVDGLGRADDRRTRRSTSTPAGMLALDVARVEAGPAAHRRRLQQQQEGADRVAEIHAVRDGPRPARAARRAAVRRPAGARSTSSAAGRRGRSSGSRSAGRPSSSCTTTLGLRAADRRHRVARRRCRSTGTAARSAARRPTTWSPVLKKLIALATVSAPHFAEGTALEFEVDGRSGAPPRAGDGGQDAVSSTRHGRQRMICVS